MDAAAVKPAPDATGRPAPPVPALPAAVAAAGAAARLREDLIQNAWIVQKPTLDGVVTSVEVFDGAGELMAMFFGSRKPA